MTTRSIGLLFSLLALSSTAWAQPSGARADNFIHRVLAGDTLSDLAQTYTRNRNNWPILQNINHVADTLALPIGKELFIPLSMIPVKEAEIQITHRTGLITVNGRPLDIQTTRLQEGDHIQTDAQGYLTLSLEDKSSLSIPANSSITLNRARTFEGTGLTDTIVALEKGDVDSSVAPASQGVGRFEVRTPVSITGVRGTSLRVRHTQTGSYSEVIQGRAELSNESTDKISALPQNYGAAIGLDGSLQALAKLPLAPQISEPARSGGQWSSTITPNTDAQSYLVLVALDAQGSKQVSRYTTQDTEIHFSARRPGEHFVLVRAISENGLMSPDTVASFMGAMALTSGDGSAIATGYGDIVLLRDF